MSEGHRQTEALGSDGVTSCRVGGPLGLLTPQRWRCCSSHFKDEKTEGKSLARPREASEWWMVTRNPEPELAHRPQEVANPALGTF